MHKFKTIEIQGKWYCLVNTGRGFQYIVESWPDGSFDLSVTYSIEFSFNTESDAERYILNRVDPHYNRGTKRKGISFVSDQVAATRHHYISIEKNKVTPIQKRKSANPNRIITKPVKEKPYADSDCMFDLIHEMFAAERKGDTEAVKAINKRLLEIHEKEDAGRKKKSFFSVLFS